MFAIGTKVLSSNTRSMSLFTWLLFVLAVALFMPASPKAQEEDAQATSDEETFTEVENLPDCGEVPPKGGQGRIVVRTKPEKAVVYLGGTKLGLSPADTAFSSGRYTLTIMLNGEELVTKRVNICPDKTTEFSKVLKAPYGSIAIHTEPIKVNAKVWVDGQEIGSTRGGILRINNLEAGTRVVKVAGGGKIREVNVDVLAEETVDVKVKLK